MVTQTKKWKQKFTLLLLYLFLLHFNGNMIDQEDNQKTNQYWQICPTTTNFKQPI